jgi:hypothetical protein
MQRESQGEPILVHRVWLMASFADVAPSTCGWKTRLKARLVPAFTVYPSEVENRFGLEVVLSTKPLPSTEMTPPMAVWPPVEIENWREYWPPTIASPKSMLVGPTEQLQGN